MTWLFSRLPLYEVSVLFHFFWSLKHSWFTGQCWFQVLLLFSRSLVSDSLRPHGLQHARPPCPSPAPEVYSNSHPLSQWWHPTISSSVFPFSSHLLSFPASGSFPKNQLFTSGGQSVGASASVLPMNIQDWFPSGWTGLISLQSKGLSRVFSNTTVQKHQFFSSYLGFFMVQLSQLYMTTGKTIISGIQHSDSVTHIRYISDSFPLKVIIQYWV